MKNLTRYSEPTKQDTATFGTKCIVTIGKDLVRTYTQCSSDEEHPDWQLTSEHPVEGFTSIAEIFPGIEEFLSDDKK